MKSLSFFALALLPLATSAAAQVAQSASGADAFTSENAILDTSVPFAIGASEARQDLRGSFGWPTFQEGLVEGVYFRFDPDGYARFAPTPRLDSDVFEVICRPRTFSCIARKGALTLLLNTRGQLEINLEGVVPGDTLYVIEGVTELQIPDRILQPLDWHLEALLSAGGELVARRGPDNEITRVSLIGFPAVTAYLRWITARQDYTVLPRGWPVPNAGGGASGALTQATGWPNTSGPAQIVGAQEFQAQAAEPVAEDSEVELLRGDIARLKQLLEGRGSVETGATEAVTIAGPAAASQPSPSADQLSNLETATAAILRELEDLRGKILVIEDSARAEAAPDPAALPVEAAEAAPEATDAAQEAPTISLADKLDFLITEIGIDPQLAVVLVEIGHPGETEGYQLPVALNEASTMSSDEILSQLLSGLNAVGQLPLAQAETSDVAAEQEPQMIAETSEPEEAPVAEATDAAEAEETPQVPELQPGEYVLIADYFASVFGDKSEE